MSESNDILQNEFTIEAEAGTDIWRKPPTTDVFNAPCHMNAPIPLSSFSRAKLSFSGKWKYRYDQGVLLLKLTKEGHQDRWVKVGVEFYNDHPYISTVGCDEYADWSIYPTDGNPQEFTMEVRREQDENGISLWVYWLRDNNQIPVREITWFFAKEDGWEVSVGASACRPASQAVVKHEKLIVKFWDFEVQKITDAINQDCKANEDVIENSNKIDIITDNYDDYYAVHFREILQTIFQQSSDNLYLSLFSTEENQIAIQFLNNLTPLAQTVYARVFQRKGTWFKLESLLLYVQNHRKYRINSTNIDAPTSLNDTTEEDTKELMQIIAQLISIGLVKTIVTAKCTTRESLETTLDAIRACVSKPDMIEIAKKLKITSKLPSKLSKDELMNMIQSFVLKQKRIDGTYLPLAKLAQDIWKSKTGQHMSKKNKSIPDIPLGIICIVDTYREVFIRIFRCYYYQATSPFQSTIPSMKVPISSDSTLSRRDILCRLALVKSDQATPSSTWPGLMEKFQRIKYPTYTVTRTIAPFGASPAAFLAYEISCRCLEVINMIQAWDNPSFTLETISLETEREVDADWYDEYAYPSFDCFIHMLDIISKKNERKDAWIGPISSWIQFKTMLTNFSKEKQSFDTFVKEIKQCFHVSIQWSCHYFDHVPIFLSKSGAATKLARCLHNAISIYEKHKQFHKAIMLLTTLLHASFPDALNQRPILYKKRGYWWNRLGVNLEKHLKLPQQAITACEEALCDKYVVGPERQSIEKRIARLQKGEKAIQVDENDEDPDINVNGDCWKVVCLRGRPLNKQAGEKSRFIGYDDEPCTVEQLVLQFYRHNELPFENLVDEIPQIGNYYGIHDEGFLLRNIFGLFMWDILYTSVPNVFQSRYQIAPLDFGYVDEFVGARQKLIEDKFLHMETSMDSMQLVKQLSETWNLEYGKRSRFVSWPDRSIHAGQVNNSSMDDMPSKDETMLCLLQLVVLALRKDRLIKLLRHMTTSSMYHHAQNGLPDLSMIQINVLNYPNHNERYPTAQEIEHPSTERLDLENLLTMCGLSSTKLNLNSDWDLDPIFTDAVTPSTIVTPEQQKTHTQGLPENILSILMDPEKCRLELMLVEVKGPRDRLSEQQILWLRILNKELYVPTHVVQVLEEERQIQKTQSKSSKKRKRN